MRIIVSFMLLCSFFCVVEVQAQEACGGQLVLNNDCSDVDSHWDISCCPSGYESVGIAYTQNQQRIKNAHIVCRNEEKGNTFIATRMYEPNPFLLMCDEGEVLTSVGYREDKKENLAKSFFVGCQNKGTQAVRTLQKTGSTKKDKIIDLKIETSQKLTGLALKKQSGTASCVSIFSK